MRLMQESGLSTLEFEEEGFSLTLRRSPDARVARATDSPSTISQAGPTAPAAAARLEGTPITAPMSGIVHLSSEPRSTPPGRTGDIVAQGEPLCLIEAMKVLTRVVAPETVRILDVLVAEGAQVSQGAPLFLVEPVKNVQNGTGRQSR
jgi:biotin carboxyl carrier protein